ncbi:unnamed protein product [Calypogeia fissa]
MFITVVPYNPAWPHAFQQIRSTLLAALKHVEILACRQHLRPWPGRKTSHRHRHRNHPNVPFAIAALEKAGYVYEGERGILDRHSFTTPLISEIDGVGMIKRNIYLCPEDALALKNHLAVRDLLTKDQELRDEYGRVKMGLAEMEVESIDEYVERKTEVLKKILGRAGLGVEELDEIEKANTRMVPRS